MEECSRYIEIFQQKTFSALGLPTKLNPKSRLVAYGWSITTIGGLCIIRWIWMFEMNFFFEILLWSYIYFILVLWEGERVVWFRSVIIVYWKLCIYGNDYTKKYKKYSVSWMQIFVCIFSTRFFLNSTSLFPTKNSNFQRIKIV